MKKVLFILFALISITTQAQVANGTETKQNAFRSLSPQTVTSPTYLATMGTDGTIGRALPDNITNEARIAVNDVSYIISGSGNKLIAYTAITADRTVTLPLANTANQRIWITDESGLCSNSRRIIVQPNGSDVIGGDSFSVINFPNGSGYLESNGAGKWNIISTTSVQFSSGVNTLPSYTDNGNGSVTLGTGVYSLYANTTGVGRPKAYQIAGGTFTLTDNSTNYIYAQYNTTTGAVSLQQSTTDSVINDLTTIPIYSIYRQGLTLHARDFDTQGVALANKLNRSIQQTQKVRVVEGGVLLGETTSPAVRTVTISAGTAWVGATEITLPAVNSATNTCYRIFPVGGVYQTTTTVTQYDNQQYSDGTNLQTLTTNNYGVRFIYRSIGNDNDMAIVVGEGNNSLGQAQVSVPPANLPAFLRHMTLVGRIIVKKGDDFATQIDQNTGGTSFASAGVTDHNALNNLQTAQTGVTYGHITDGAQTIAGVKTMVNTGATQISGLNLTNNGTGGTSSIKVETTSSGDGAQFINSPTSSGGGISFLNNGVNLSSTSIYLENNNIGKGILGYNNSTGVLVSLNSQLSSTGDLFQIKKDGVFSNRIDHLGVITSSPTVSASSGIAKGTIFTPTLIATANNNFLVGLDILPTFSNGAFTNVSNASLRVSGAIITSTNANIPIGSTSNNFSTIHVNSVLANNNLILDTSSSNDIIFRTGFSSRMRLFNSGNLIIQNGGVFTDAGYRLDVQGTTRLNGTTTLGVLPTTSAGTYDILTRNTSTGVVEKVASTTYATTASPAFTGTPTAPTATSGTNTTQIATTAFVTGNFVGLTGDQTKSGLLTFSDNTGSTVINGVSLSNSGTNSTSGVINVVNTSSGIAVRASTSSTGPAFVADGLSTSSAFLFAGRDNGSNTFTVNRTGDVVARNITSNGSIRLKSYTVATLPASPTQGDMAYVTDATAPTYLGTLTGGGSVVCPVFYNGTAWVSH